MAYLHFFSRFLLLLPVFVLTGLHHCAVLLPPQAVVTEDETPSVFKPLRPMMDALEVMQVQYFDIFSGTWPSAIDWTAAVMGTHVSAALSSLVSSIEATDLSTCTDLLQWHNTIDRYFAQISLFYFGENAFSIRNQAYDDMLWVVLGWLENVKFIELYSSKHWQSWDNTVGKLGSGWHGLQFSPMAAHRSRIFYELASSGWDTELCNGGMIWNPRLTPYKNAITTELFISASISMYLYFPGDNNTSPYLAQQEYNNKTPPGLPHDTRYLGNAVKGYKWLRESGMQSLQSGLYQDGFHVTGWYRFPNGTIAPGTRECDELNSMVYTYNQGVLLTAHRGLWIATGQRSYLDDGHTLVESVIRATGWPNHDRYWRGLGRSGVLEEFCDRGGYCSQDSQTFKGIFFHHLTEFCRPLRDRERKFLEYHLKGFDKRVYRYHLQRCGAYGTWVAHNAKSAEVTKDPEGRYGMWWGRQYRNRTWEGQIEANPSLSTMAIDHVNDGLPADWSLELSPKRQKSQKSKMEPVRPEDVNDRGRGRTVETQSGGLAVLRAQWQWASRLDEALDFQM